jgi:hypothetical protein
MVKKGKDNRDNDRVGNNSDNLVGIASISQTNVVDSNLTLVDDVEDVSIIVEQGKLSKGASLAARSNILIISNKVDSSFFADIEKVSTISLLDDEFTLFALLLLRSLHKRVEHSFVVKSEKMKFSPKASSSRNLTSSLDLG